MPAKKKATKPKKSAAKTRKPDVDAAIKGD